MLIPSIFGDNFVDNFFDDVLRTPVTPQRTVQLMKTDIKEHNGGYEIEMNLPGFAKEDVKAELKDGYLTVTASHNTQNEENNENEKYIRRERYSGHYQRSFYIGEDLTEEDIHAAFKDGVLTMSIPKKEPEAPVEEPAKYISIEG